ncbi:hypothetical protein ASE17_19975 [Phenylobacterium sp. Root77]|jgi:hypothetical protein|uniref:hypothetical protein n=1 Tax=unclassified Phenylobacterium TaxID=2640670 RepID=UPI0006F529D2|nr:MULTISPECIES: hypothetical protein [unclassified Phenylobacterium]KQW66958.1 hypothetical protein ASC73_17630 [Phenylobacterium sp. Root1277]KQW89651.1 hypothetical protein ASC79_18535 [Phenylobacterium sp. Root1290]KRC43480.1 hypothetical protein ASE17_19975 [Phenylobacterium sp. Root77]
MSVRLDEDAIRLEGDCPADDAERLVVLIEAAPGWPIDLSACGRLHTAVVQALLHAGSRLIGDAPVPFVRDHLALALRATRAHMTDPTKSKSDDK